MMESNEQTSVSTTRQKPVKVSKVLTEINFQNLESFQEMELEKRRERVQMFNTFGW